MKIDTFVKLFSTKKTEEEKSDAINQVMKHVSISYSDKLNRANLIARHSYYTKEKDINGVENEVFKQNSAAKYMLYSLTMVDLYTNIDIDYKQSIECFEKINGEILDRIICAIDERERKEFQMLLDFACDDIIVNEYELHSFIGKQIDRFGALIGASLTPILNSIDLNKLEEIVSQIK